MPVKKQDYLEVDVIASFAIDSLHEDTQEHFTIKVPMAKSDKDITFVNNKVFPRLINKCKTRGRDVTRLHKISTAANWTKQFLRITGAAPTAITDKNGKWWFATDRDDMDSFDKLGMNSYGFGTSVKMYQLTTDYIESLISKA